jgi:hypothetical protein
MRRHAHVNEYKYDVSISILTNDGRRRRDLWHNKGINGMKRQISHARHPDAREKAACRARRSRTVAGLSIVVAKTYLPGAKLE